MNISVFKSIFFRGALVGLLAILFFSTNAVGDEWHYKNLIVGERSAGMAGAYSAVADTPEGSYYNPAGLVYASGKSLSASVNAYHSTWTTYKGVLGGGDWERRSSSLIPNFFGMVQPFGEGKVAFSYAAPDLIEEDQNQVFYNFNNVDSFTINLSNLEKTYKIGPSYAVKLNDRLSFGITAYLHYRQEKLIFNQYFLLNDGSFEWSNTNYRKSEYGFNPKVGFMWSPADKLSVALAVEKTEIFRSKTRSQYSGQTDALVQNITVTPEPDVNREDDERHYPTHVTLGFALFPSESTIYSCDIDYYTKVSSENKDAVLNVSLGMEHYLSSSLAFRGGLYTNVSNAKVVEIGTESVNMYGVTASISRFAKASSITMGLDYSRGKGDSRPVNSATVYDVEKESLTVFLSAVYNY